MTSLKDLAAAIESTNLFVLQLENDKKVNLGSLGEVEYVDSKVQSASVGDVVWVVFRHENDLYRMYGVVEQFFSETVRWQTDSLEKVKNYAIKERTYKKSEDNSKPALTVKNFTDLAKSYGWGYFIRLVQKSSNTVAVQVPNFPYDIYMFEDYRMDGEGSGEIWMVLRIFDVEQNKDRFFKIEGYYDSYDGETWNQYHLREVVPHDRVVRFYDSVWSTH